LVTDKDLRRRGRTVKDLDARRYQAITFRDALIIQAVNEGRTKAEVAGLVGITKARVGKIVANGIGAE
jgi:hypothetical protein